MTLERQPRQPRNMVPVDFSIYGWRDSPNDPPGERWGRHWITADFPAGVFYLQSEVDAIREEVYDGEWKLTLTVVAYMEGEDLVSIAFDVLMPVPGIPEWVALEQRVRMPNGHVLTAEQYNYGRRNGTLPYWGSEEGPDDIEDRIFYEITDYKLVS